VIPRAFPHKSYEGEVSLEDRLLMLEHVSLLPYSIAISEGGLFIEMCDEFQRAAGPAEVSIVCGRDAAERILTWDYGDDGALDRMFQSFGLMVAARRGEFEAPARFHDRIRTLGIAPEHDTASSTEVRERIRSGEDWRHLVPEMVVPFVERLY
jgi:nicotinic acid mononucleotide adenylyltransferase